MQFIFYQFLNFCNKSYVTALLAIASISVCLIVGRKLMRWIHDLSRFRSNLGLNYIKLKSFIEAKCACDCEKRQSIFSLLRNKWINVTCGDFSVTGQMRWAGRWNAGSKKTRSTFRNPLTRGVITRRKIWGQTKDWKLGGDVVAQQSFNVDHKKRRVDWVSYYFWRVL